MSSLTYDLGLNVVMRDFTLHSMAKHENLSEVRFCDAKKEV